MRYDRHAFGGSYRRYLEARVTIGDLIRVFWRKIWRR